MIFAFKTATLGPELQVSMGARPHLWFFAFKIATLAPELQVSMRLIVHLWFCAFKSASFAAEKLVSMDPSPPLWLLHAKLRLYHQNYKSLWVPPLICGFCMQNNDFRTRITSLYGS